MKTLLRLLFFILLLCITANAQWTLKHTFTGAESLWWPVAVDENVLWGSLCYSSSASIYGYFRTTDGGNSWQYDTISNNLRITCTHPRNANIAYYGMYNGLNPSRIVKTTDGGLTWVTQITAFGNTNFIDYIYFFDDNNGFSIGEPIEGYLEIYTTTNGGENWIRVPNSSIPQSIYNEYPIENAFCVVDNTIWMPVFIANDNQIRIFKSTDRGYSWTASNQFSSQILQLLPTSIVFKNQIDGILILSHFFDNTTDYKMFKTSDGGNTWTELNFPLSMYPAFICNIPGTSQGYLITSPLGKKGSAFTLDGGNSWNLIEITLDLCFPKFTSDSCGWAISKSTPTVYKYLGPLYGNIYAIRPCIDKSYARKNIDSILFQTVFANIYNHQFTPYLIYISTDSTQIDSLSLFDDGLHGDSLSGDGIYGNYISPQQTENFYSLSISTIDNQTNKYFNTPDLCRFTTAGSIKLDSVRLVKGITNYYNLKPFVKNEGTGFTITNAKIQLKCDDPWVSGIAGAISIPSIAPGVSLGASSWIAVSYYDSIFPGYFNLKAEISVDGWTYWFDSIRINVITGLEEEASLPSAFQLEQNFPNPFNPSTTIGYVLQEKSYAKLTILNVIGEEVAILVNEEQDKGYHKVEFDGSKLPSGVYFYKLVAKDFVNTKKMILVK